MNRTAIISGAIFGLLTVGIGAFGAHALKDLLTANNSVGTFETAVHYQSIHALALLFIGILSEKLNNRFLHYSTSAMILGTVIFSGSLYALSISGISTFGAITPIGGLALIIGWMLLIIAAVKNN